MSKTIDPQQDKKTQTLTSQKILEALQGIRYGSVEIIIHDGRIVQIERKEKLRLDNGCSPGQN
ncbi:MAG TPA: YezD family protein [Methylococcaceae bacterium]|jgi:hypothetical protein|nr:YezD family protein [Methylococcaceae bacterium]